MTSAPETPKTDEEVQEMTERIVIQTALAIACLIRNLGDGLRVGSTITAQEALFGAAEAIEVGVAEMQQMKGTTH